MLRIENLMKTYPNGKRAVDCISLHVAAGEIFAFIGPNGAGKTTTIKAACGLMDFDSGEVYIDGLRLKDNEIECKKRMAYIPDDPILYDNLTGLQYLRFVADLYGVSDEDRKARIGKYADAFELRKALGDWISSYSHGMRQKLAVIAALVHAPKLLVLDEPFVGLDPKAAFTLKQIMHELCEQGGAIFFSTHVLDVAEKLCDHVAILSAGKIVQEGDMETVKGDQSLESLFLELTENA